MEILDLSEKHHSQYFCCLEDWSDEMKEAGDHKKIWYNKMKDKGLRVKLAVEDEKVCGMIQYAPAEESIIEGENLHFIYCIWVHGHKQGIGNYQKKGIGKKLLQTAEADVQSMEQKGIAAWGISLPFWMKAKWFKKHGYKKVDKDGMAVLVWKSFSKDAKPPRWIRKKESPQKAEGKVSVTAFVNGWCPAQNLICERARRASQKFGKAVEFREINTFDQASLHKWGISDALFIDGKRVRTGPPPSYEKLQRKIGRKAKRIKVY